MALLTRKNHLSSGRSLPGTGDRSNSAMDLPFDLDHRQVVPGLRAEACAQRLKSPSALEGRSRRGSENPIPRGLSSTRPRSTGLNRHPALSAVRGPRRHRNLNTGRCRSLTRLAHRLKHGARAFTDVPRQPFANGARGWRRPSTSADFRRSCAGGQTDWPCLAVGPGPPPQRPARLINVNGRVSVLGASGDMANVRVGQDHRRRPPRYM